MASTFTPNIQLEEPQRGDQFNAWAPTVNAIMTSLDLAHGGAVTISATGLPLTLSASQFQAKTLIFNSTLTANATVTFSASFVKSYEIQHLCTGSSVFTITLATTAAGGQVIGVPPGETISIINNGGNLSYLALHHVGDYWDHAGSSVPGWVSVCTIPPYLNCDGTSFNSSVYPALFTVLGSSVLPDSRGRARWALNQGTTRLSSSGSGINGGAISAAGGQESLPGHIHAITDPGHVHGHNFLLNSGAIAIGGAVAVNFVPVAAATINSAVTGITINNSTIPGTTQNMPPAYIGGLTMIRAA